MPEDMLNKWPSLMENTPLNPWPEADTQQGNESEISDPKSISEETFNNYITEMKGFMNYVLKISFNLVHYHKSNPLAKQKFDSFFPPKRN